MLGDIISPLPGPSQPVVTAEIEEIPGPLPVTVVDQASFVVVLFQVWHVLYCTKININCFVQD